MQPLKLLSVLLVLASLLVAPAAAEDSGSLPHMEDLPGVRQEQPSAFVSEAAREWFARYLQETAKDYEQAGPDARWDAARALGRSLLRGLEEDQRGFMCFDVVQSYSSRRLLLGSVAEAAAAIERSDFFARSFQRRIDQLQSAIHGYRRSQL